MFSRVIAILALAAVAVSAGGSSTATHDGIKYSCNTGAVSCCNSLQSAQSAQGTAILSLVGVAAQGVTGQVADNCSPISVIGVGSGANCASSPVCCEDNFQNQLVGVNCSPATVLV